MTGTDSHHTWWQDAVVYQIYPRSFADSGRGGIEGSRHSDGVATADDAVTPESFCQELNPAS